MAARTYYSLTHHERDDTDHVSTRYELGNAPRLGPWSCQPLLAEQFEKTRLFVDGTTVADYLPNTLSWPICSARFLRVFQEAVLPSDMQTFPLTVLSAESGKTVGPYTLVNILRCLDVLDRERTTFARTLPVAVNPVIRMQAIPLDVQICRLKDLGTEVVVSNKILANARKAGVTGVTFVPIEAVP